MAPKCAPASESKATSTAPASPLEAILRASTLTLDSATRNAGDTPSSATRTVPSATCRSATEYAHGEAPAAGAAAPALGSLSGASKRWNSTSSVLAASQVDVRSLDGDALQHERPAERIELAERRVDRVRTDEGEPSLRVTASRSRRAVPDSVTVRGSPFSLTNASLSRVVSAPSLSLRPCGSGT